jgi:murein DD-endopeptidase MepM/ murein hydrolase activator NlpD
VEKEPAPAVYQSYSATIHHPLAAGADPGVRQNTFGSHRAFRSGMDIAAGTGTPIRRPLTEVVDVGNTSSTATTC